MRTTKMDKKKRLCVFVFCLLQVAFVLCFLGLFVQKIAREFESINASYISRANAVFEPQYRVLHRSASSFCYQISGAPNGEVLEVWACNVSNGAPYVCTHPVEGGARA